MLVSADPSFCEFAQLINVGCSTSPMLQSQRSCLEHRRRIEPLTECALFFGADVMAPLLSLFISAYVVLVAFSLWSFLAVEVFNIGRSNRTLFNNHLATPYNLGIYFLLLWPFFKVSHILFLCWFKWPLWLYRHKWLLLRNTIYSVCYYIKNFLVHCKLSFWLEALVLD